jgi:nicotinamide-nucleotide amidase
MISDRVLSELSEQTGKELLRLQRQVTAAESCTGGWIAKVFTDISGSSAWFERGFVTYSNEAKQQMLGVSAASLNTFGAVSEAVVREMASGALAAAHADYAISVSGIAGPDGGTQEKPVGTVWFGFASAAGEVATISQHFQGDRDAVRRQSVAFSLNYLLNEFLKNSA